MNLTITTDQILWVCTIAGALWSVWKIVKELKKPSDDLKKEVAEHSRKLSNDNKRLLDFEESNQMVLRSLLVIINHEITGNGIEKMKETRDELQNFLINK